ncbi:MAG: amidohydrolase family protein [Gemmataceae bacterium]|nr:amidohydrolase family protein [Gemmataceae bacterium]
MAEVIDAHQHFWQLSKPFDYRWLDKPEHAPIRRDYLAHDLKPLMDAAGVDRCVFVQTQHDLRENEWALALASEHPWIAGVVGWLDLADPGLDKPLAELRKNPKFVGVRHLVQDEADDDFVIRPEIMRGLRLLERRGVPFDMLFHVKHLRHARTLGLSFPSLPLVIDHLAKPRIRDGSMADWLPHLEKAAECRNVFVKLSGLVTEAKWDGWKVADLKPYIRKALDLFGPERCMFGSDWPVSVLAADYGGVKAALEEALGPISADERAMVFGGTARRFYGLDS